jgi:hypothetical protein
VRRDIPFEANMKENMKQIFICYEAKKNRFYLLVLHQSESADFICEMNKNESEYYFLSKYFT